MTLSANRYEAVAGDAGAKRRTDAGTPNGRYLRRARRHAAHGMTAGVLAVLFAAWSFLAALSEAPGWSIAAGCTCALAVFIATLETKESLRCLRIAARWIRWDRETGDTEP
jgi:hypothetical protein